MLKVVDKQAHENFNFKVHKYFNTNPNSKWYAGYVEYEWKHLRHTLNNLPMSIENSSILEIGCNVGASAIIAASLGGNVTAVDIDPRFIDVANDNIMAYGFNHKINLQQIDCSGKLPFQDHSFDLIIANSVLEYVDDAIIHLLLNELDRILAPNGIILIQGTSNRLWPKEVHSKRLFVNYIPRFIDKIIGKKIQRGISPFKIKRSFSNYTHLELSDKSEQYLKIRSLTGWSKKRIQLIRMIAHLISPIGLSPGMLLPNITMTLHKKAS